MRYETMGDKMDRITGLEEVHQVPPKVHQMYRAVIQLLEEGADAASISVSSITERAGIGKGTAYEYFDTKEEIIACAIVYQMQCIFGQLENALEQRGTFREQLDFLLEQMEKKGDGMHCFLRFVHLMTDNSEFYHIVRRKMDSEAFKPYLPMNVIGKVLRQGVERGEVRRDAPVEYLVYCIFSHLLTYMMVMMGECFQGDVSEMRLHVRQGILNELEEK